MESVALLRHLQQARGAQQTSFLSYILPRGTKLGLAVQRLEKEHDTASNIKDRQNRRAVQTALVDAISSIKGLVRIPDTGIAVFSGQCF